MRHQVLAALLAATALACAGCAAEQARSVEPSPAIVSSGEVQPPQLPRPTASPDMAPRGPAQVVRSVDTKDKVVFLTLDDGVTEDPATMRYLSEEGIPVTVFLTTGTVTDWDYWRDMAAVGSIQNHSVSHAAFPGLGYAGQVREMCEASSSIDDRTGEAPWMVRPPYGAFDDGTLAAAGQCGLDYVVHWTATMGSGRLQYQTAKGGLDRGDIILGHFTPDLARTLPMIVEQIRAEGFEIGRLEDYLLPRGWKAPATSTESRAYFVG